jgi:hypothetical protein
MSHKSTIVVAVAALLVVLPLGFALGQGGTSNSLPPSTSTTPPPPITGQSSPPPNAPLAVQGVAAEEPFSATGLAKPGADGVTTKIVPARPCSRAAKETDGTTTCVGIPDRR